MACHRLVHRLDRETSGALVVARTAAAAAWLSAAFSTKSAAAAGGPGASTRAARSSAAAGGVGAAAGSGGVVAARAPQVQRVYWAVVEAGDNSRLQREGVIEVGCFGKTAKAGCNHFWQLGAAYRL